MDPDDNVCLCFHVSLRKIRSYLARENPPVASLISECLGAGTGCQWCVPFLKHLHRMNTEGKPVDLRISPEAYAKGRTSFHRSGERDAEVVAGATDADELGEDDASEARDHADQDPGAGADQPAE